ncbi:MAG: DUF2281 domain-containing protein [Bacteroidota bacterium]|nr:DUF2281 domain-containing protein [Bacteroidota bacterium]
MSNEEILKKYSQLNPESKKEVDNMLEQLTTKNNFREDENTVPLYGLLKGKIKMAPDFDEPLEDFKDYM